MAKRPEYAYLQSVVPALTAGLVALLVLAIAWQLDRVEQRRHDQDFRAQLTARLVAARAELESALSARLHLVHGLAALAATHEQLSHAEFQSFAARLFESQPGIRSLQLAPDAVVRYVYPLAGNEAALDHDLLADSARSPAVRLAIDTDGFLVSGPVRLRQGGVGLIGRKPVHSPVTDGRSRLWGLAVVVLDFDHLLQDVGLAQLDGMQVALRGRDAKGDFGEPFHGPAAVFDADPVRLDVSLPSGRWVIAAAPSAGWPTSWPGRDLLRDASLMLAALAALLVFVLLRRPGQLRRAVSMATADLRESRSRYQLLFDQTPNAIMVLDAETLRPLEFNEMARQTLGYDRDVLLKLSAADWDMGDREDGVARHSERLARTGEEQFETVYCTAGGEQIDVWVSMRPVTVDGRQAVHTVFRDITAERQLDAQLRKLSHAVEQSSSMVMITDAHGVIEYVNPKLARCSGYAVEELVGRRPSMLRSEATGAEVYRGLWQAITTGGEWHGELLNRRKDGSLYWVSTGITALVDAGGRITHFVAVQEDITDSKAAREAVAQQLRFQQALIDGLPTPVFYEDEESVLLGCNQAFVEFVGRPRAAMIGQRFAELSDQFRLSDGKADDDRELLRSGGTQSYETSLCLADGRRLEVLFRKAVFQRADGRPGGIIGTLLDITERKRMEVMLRRAAEGVSGEVGQAFFQSLSRYLAEALEVDFAFVGEVDRRTEDQVHTLAVVGHGQPAENFTYRLQDTPCANVINQGVCLHPRAVRELYPKDELLQKMAMESYAGYPLRDPQGRTLGLLVVMHSRPIENLDSILSFLQIFAARASAELQRRRAEEDLRMAATVFETTSEAIMVTDENNTIKAVNPAFTLITGYREDEVLGRNPAVLRSGRHDAGFYSAMWSALDEHGHWEGEIWNRRKNGEVYPEWLSISAIRDVSGARRDHVAVFSDITKRKRDEEKIWRQANFDALTGLPNRFLFMDRLLRALNQAHETETQVGLLLIDLDRLKWINDMLGHASGDRLLQHVAQRLLTCVHSEASVSRWAGDEFSIIVPESDAGGSVEQMVESVQAALSRPFVIDNQEAFVTASIGLAVFPDDGRDPESLMSNATGAMVQAKSNGGNGYRRYSNEISKRAIERISLERDLHWAVERSELVLNYQPIMDLRAGRVVGAECLVRWQHPRRGLIAPDIFIPLAEETGLIGQIGEWVLRRVSLEAAQWRASGLPPVHFAVNVSRHQFMRRNFEGQVLDAIREGGAEPSMLVLEVTESAMAEDERALIEVMQRLRQHGLRWSMDDFGTGYSSLSNLKNIPVDLLKIDKSFIADVDSNPDDAAVVRAIVVMAQSLGLRVVAEGVAAEAQHAFVRELGCEYGQGYLFSAPLSLAEFKAYLRRRLPPPVEVSTGL